MQTVTTQTKKLYRYPYQKIEEYVEDYPELLEISKKPQAVWITDWTQKEINTVCEIQMEAIETNTIPILVVYFIPDRDEGNHSTGGFSNYDQYVIAVYELFSLLRTETMVIFEPDAIPLDFNTNRKKTFTKILEKADIRYLKLYLDIGHPNWHSVDTVKKLLSSLPLNNVDGISINVSNFVEDKKCLEYGNKICESLSKRNSELHFVIDSSRNGNGATKDHEWCNPPNRKLGKKPGINVNGYFDGYLWIKLPGESDGECNGGPPAGEFWVDYALELIRNR